MKAKIRILHIDDNIHDRILVKDVLMKENRGFEVIEADNREKFEEYLEKEHFDLVLSDFNILGFDGLQVLKTVKEKRPELPVIIVTGTGSEEIAIQAMKMGASDYVIKSVKHIKGLAPTIKAVLDHKKTETERKDALDALKESEEKYRSIYENSSIAILLTVPDGRILSANDYACKLFRMTEEEICNANREGLVDISDPALQLLLNERARTGKAKGELTFLRKDGSKFKGEVSSVVFMDKDGKNRTSMAIRDLTEQRNTEESLKFRNILLSTQMEVSIDGILIVDENNKIVSFNHRFVEIFNISKALIDKREDESVLQYVIGMIREPELFLQRVQYLYEHKEETSFEELYLTDGRILDRNSSPMVGSDGHYYGRLWNFRDVTNRKNDEESIRKNEAQFRSYFESSIAGIAITSPKTGWIEVNDRLCEILGYSKDELLKLTWTELTHPDDLNIDLENFNNVLEGKIEGYSIDKRFIRKDGNFVWTSLSVRCVRYADGNVDYFVALLIDINERKLTESALRKSEEYNRLLFNSSPIGLALCRMDGSLIDINPAYAKIIGRTIEETLKLTYWDITPEKYATQEAEQSKNLKETGHYGKYEKEYIHKDGHLVPVLLQGLILERDGERFIWSSIEDITERKSAEVALQESQQLFQTLAQMSPVGIFKTGSDGNTTYVNPKWSELSGLSLEEALGTGWIKAVHPEDREKISGTWINNYKSKKESSAEYRFLKPDGSIIWVMGNAVPELIDNRVTGYIGTITDITNRKHTEKALSESEAKYRQLVTQSPDGIFIFDLSGKFLSVNRAICDSLNYTEEELLSMKLSDIVPEQYHSLHAQRLATIMNGESTTSNAEYEVVGKDGTAHFVEVQSVPYYKGGKIIGFQGIARDITERKTVEEVLRKSQQIIEGIMNAIPVRVFWKDENLVYMGCNSIFARDAGFDDPKDVIGKNDYQMGWHDQAELYRGDDQQVIDSGNSKFFIEEVQTTPAGKTITLLTSKIPLLGSKGEINGILGTYIDITDRKKSEVALRESEEKLRRIFENVQDMFFEASIDGIMLEVSPSVELISKGQYKRDDVIGKSMFYFIKDPVEGEALMNILMERGFVSDYEILLRNRDGSNIPCSVSSRIYFDANKRPEKIIGSMRDITERKNTSDALKLAKEKAEESDRLKTAFLHNISHEIRTPMNAIVGFSALLTEPGLDEASMLSFIDTITQSSNQLLAIINDIIEIANIEAGILKSSKNEIQINLVFQRLFDQFYPVAIEKNIELIKESSLADNEAIILSDNTKFIQILTNLLSNALKFTVKGRIEFGYFLNDRFLNFYVSDTGIGIPENQFQRIFDRFYQVEHMMARHFEGTGLGLSISKAYVELMGGKIWVESEPGKGATFYFSLPFNKPESNDSDNLTSLKEVKFNKPLTILVAEDNDANFKLIEMYLADPVFSLIYAKNGFEAVKYCESEQKIDLVLMDLKMPEMDGYLATEKISNLRPGLPVIAQTAFATDNDKALNCGCVDILTKPFKKNELLQIINKHLNN
jgi:PAS domain S-box-containing protein